MAGKIMILPSMILPATCSRKSAQPAKNFVDSNTKDTEGEVFRVFSVFSGLDSVFAYFGCFAVGLIAGIFLPLLPLSLSGLLIRERERHGARKFGGKNIPKSSCPEIFLPPSVLLVPLCASSWPPSFAKFLK